MEQRSKKDSEEHVLLLGLRAGNEQAFAGLYQRYKRKIVVSALRLLKSEALAEEIVQETFLKVWEHRATLDPDKSFGAFLHRIAHHLVMDVFRKSALDQKMRDQLISQATDYYTHVEERIFSLEHQEQLDKALALLPPQRKRVFTMFKMEGKSYREIGDELGISKATINEHISKANRFLREHFNTDKTLFWLVVAKVLLES